MAIGWLAVLKSVPWSEVISTAPKVAEGARKLWHAVGKKPLPAADGAAFRPDSGAADALNPAAWVARLRALDAAVADLQGQMMASSELIKALAEQNSQLIQRMEKQRRRVLGLGVATAVLALGLLCSLLLMFRAPV